MSIIWGIWYGGKGCFETRYPGDPTQMTLGWSGGLTQWLSTRTPVKHCGDILGCYSM